MNLVLKVMRCDEGDIAEILQEICTDTYGQCPFPNFDCPVTHLHGDMRCDNVTAKHWRQVFETHNKQESTEEATNAER